MRIKPLLVTLALFITGCSGDAKNNSIEVRTHELAPWMAADMPQWTETIKTTVVPEDWNADGSPHRISYDKNVLTVRTTAKHQEEIIAYLAQAMRKYQP